MHNSHLGEPIERVERGERWGLQSCGVVHFKGFAPWPLEHISAEQAAPGY